MRAQTHTDQPQHIRGRKTVTVHSVLKDLLNLRIVLTVLVCCVVLSCGIADAQTAEREFVLEKRYLNLPVPGMPFNQMVTFPAELALRSTTEGIRLCADPIKEIELLPKRDLSLTDVRKTGNLLPNLDENGYAK